MDTYNAGARRWGDGKRYVQFWSTELEVFRRLLPSGRVLDVGSGTGTPTQLLCSAGYEVVGVDVSESMLQIAAENCPRAEFHLASVYELPFADASFDGAWLAASLLHLPKARINEALTEVRRVLAPHGAAFIAVKRGHGERIEHTGIGDRFLAYYQPDELRRAVEQAGLPVVRIQQREAPAATWVCVWIALDRRHPGSA